MVHGLWAGKYEKPTPEGTGSGSGTGKAKMKAWSISKGSYHKRTQKDAWGKWH
eukprot:CAMPEP_0184315992 /NCGR_PEP_ID=MMETSP1049-20130417/87186_1 /TAXON_ID=77928 /ORGANISM="Proteomonas sulcata, Strain CCMP704" /LENGTH=52 /DNA_ID=CAMNT_0026634773 /DNA_START=194 /DNA_END=352 /DNA_ORIENTATION=+